MKLKLSFWVSVLFTLHTLCIVFCPAITQMQLTESIQLCHIQFNALFFLVIANVPNSNFCLKGSNCSHTFHNRIFPPTYRDTGWFQYRERGLHIIVLHLAQSHWFIMLCSNI